MARPNQRPAERIAATPCPQSLARYVSRNQFQFVCILLYGRFLLKTLKLTFLFHSLLIQGAATAIGAGNKVKDLLNQAARQVKGGR